MVNIPFNPFEASFDKLTTDDLSTLRNVAEGWYVEYKSEANTKSIAKSLAAFANHYGGWIFYGVTGAKDGSNTAETFPGLDKKEAGALIENIRNAARSAVTPHPYYEYRTLEGPCDKIGLPPERCIIVVIVPPGPDTPYIHSDGRIYRRIADSSDPKQETDRFVLDYLWRRGQRAHDKLAAFFENEPVLSNGESDELSFVDLFFLPDPLGVSGQRSNLDFDQFFELMSDKTAPGISLIYDNFFTIPDGFIARDININNPYNLVTTWRHFRNGFSHVSILLPSTLAANLNSNSWLHGYMYQKAFLRSVLGYRYEDCDILDVNLLIFLVIAAFNQQTRLMDRGGIKGPLYTKATLHNVWRRIPFLDTESYIQFIEKHGIPLIQFENELIPPGKTFDSLVPPFKDLSPDIDNPIIIQSLKAAPLLASISNALGIPNAVGILKTDEWWEAAQRAQQVNKLRATMSSR